MTCDKILIILFERCSKNWKILITFNNNDNKNEDFLIYIYI